MSILEGIFVFLFGLVLMPPGSIFLGGLYLFLFGVATLPIILLIVYKKRSIDVVLINILLGWTIVGWIVALVKAIKLIKSS